MLLGITVGFLVGIVFASFFEWTLHRHLMHRPVAGFNYAFNAHAVVHHQTFRADHTYHLIREDDKQLIPMAWWHGPVLIGICQIPFAIAAGLIGNWAVLLGSLLASCSYFFAYEYLHWCMHLPRRRNIERSGIFFRLNGHHLLHHRYMHKNFNVVFPLADLCLGTLLLRSKVHFAQARGYCVPDVQPKQERKSRRPELAVHE